jgi:hypothetical protein
VGAVTDRREAAEASSNGSGRGQVSPLQVLTSYVHTCILSLDRPGSRIDQVRPTRSGTYQATDHWGDADGKEYQGEEEMLV